MHCRRGGRRAQQRQQRGGAGRWRAGPGACFQPVSPVNCFACPVDCEAHAVTRQLLPQPGRHPGVCWLPLCRGSFKRTHSQALGGGSDMLGGGGSGGGGGGASKRKSSEGTQCQETFPAIPRQPAPAEWLQLPGSGRGSAAHCALPLPGLLLLQSTRKLLRLPTCQLAPTAGWTCWACWPALLLRATWERQHNRQGRQGRRHRAGQAGSIGRFGFVGAGRRLISRGSVAAV